jgi:hypothetical protein
MDVVELGEPDRAHPRRAPLVMLAALLALLVVAGMVRSRDPKPEPAAQGPTPLGAISIAPVEPLQTRDVTLEPDGPPEWTLPPLRTPTGLQLAGSGDGLTVVALDGGKTVSTPVADSGLAEVRVTARLGDAWVAVVGSPCHGEEVCPHLPVYVVRAGRATKVGEGDDAFADPDGTTVWLTGRTDTSTQHGVLGHWVERRAASGARTGTRIGARTTLHGEEELVGVTAEGPVVSAQLSGEGGATLIDARTRTRRVVAKGWTGGSLAVSGHHIARSEVDCYSEGVLRCHVATTDVRTGRTSRVEVGAQVDDMALDPAGRYLAVRIGGEEQPVFAVADLRSGTVMTLADSPAFWQDGLAWAPDGRWLVVTHEVKDAEGLHNRTQLAVWRPGQDHLEAAGTTDAEPGRFVVAYSR